MKNLSGSQSIERVAPLSARSLQALIRTMRPRQWIKNIFVFAAIAFSEGRLWYTEPVQLLRVIGAFIAFCMAASAIYLINDLVDIEKDRAHPKKRHRPLAAGILSPTLAMVTAAILIIAVFPFAFWLDGDLDFMLVLAIYIAVQGFLYSYWLKNVVIFDILIIAAGFILRAVAGAVVIDIVITPWLIVCMGLLALFLGIGKRRHELKLLEDGAGNHRRILDEYSIPLLDQMQAIVTASIVMAYSMTAFSAPVAPQKPFPMLMITIPFVVYAIFRYLYLIHQRDGGGAPEDLVLQDRPLALSIVLWGVTVLGVLVLFPS
ncbi:MAG TPA: decaprenyl-phosphate phosphoribosyltransferase [Chloroflexus aurantiacus]|jgi:4-hydroxybenzoate polyprenyltransferase|uniref:UbiA prenyltransferase n=1 Tax=Chloroflexus aurantiacus (strain ATCC 29366 / DSM 635 / J-10-fl) TaxID=324602 RepID=A9WE93_CHLAA|nr:MULTISPECIES: decaprenyl-phosphate phosphoribosyltransferase [Chloroflexus]ABY33753.1 UbiA prenyltransferase [Chloroflexus aurantiacus J-10-fl]RMG52776.1 MAG: decaprenyl-phosphate phosphoribosyltransferase [Chloroflexota bacterium]GIV94382.1 MAG: decaprenyl-phosphate phosphoribosyltransferase [Chloroflexus sp.]HBW68202.1 decaprenyl-phosphate phosphoribosyltransferase [Chloroflexus aurantiacus]